MGCIVTKLEETQLTSIALSVFVMNLFKIQKQILCAFLHLIQFCTNGQNTKIGTCKYLLNQQTLM